MKSLDNGYTTQIELSFGIEEDDVSGLTLYH